MADHPARSEAEGAPDGRHFRKKPVVIEAVQWTGDNLREVIAFTGRHPSAADWTWEHFEEVVKRDGLIIFTLEGKHLATVGDFIIRGVKGEHYPCKPDIFAATYEPASTAPSPRAEAVALTAEDRKYIEDDKRVLNNNLLDYAKHAPESLAYEVEFTVGFLRRMRTYITLGEAHLAATPRSVPREVTDEMAKRAMDECAISYGDSPALLWDSMSEAQRAEALRIWRSVLVAALGGAK